MSIANYLEQIEQEMYPVSDYSYCCPLCGAADCAIFYRFYYRKMVIINFKIYHDFPIIRMRCRRKGKISSPHKTFSLLPHMLVPYRQHDLNTMYETLKYQQTGKSSTQIKDHISQMGAETDIPLENKQIDDFNKIFTAAAAKLSSIPQLKQRLQQTAGFDSSNPIGSVVSFIDNYSSTLAIITAMNTSDIVKLAHEFFYHFQTDTWSCRHFLFGTPSQRR